MVNSEYLSGFPIPTGLSSGEVHLWRIHQDFPGFANQDGLLSPQEQVRAACFRFTIHRRRFVARHVALRQILSAYLGQAPERLEFTRTPHGKPSLPGLQFNLSSSSEYAVCAVSLDNPLGVDVEHQRPLDDMDSLARVCLSPAEYTVFQNVADKNQAFFDWWTAKEACFKALGLGITAGLDKVELDLAQQTLVLAPELARIFPQAHLYRFIVAPGYPAALVLSAPAVRFQQFSISSMGFGWQ